MSAYAALALNTGGKDFAKDFVADRLDDPRLRAAATGTITREEWCKGGKVRRADGPAYIERDSSTGIVTRDTWWKDGKQAVAPEPREAITDTR